MRALHRVTQLLLCTFVKLKQSRYPDGPVPSVVLGHLHMLFTSGVSYRPVSLTLPLLKSRWAHPWRRGAVSLG